MTTAKKKTAKGAKTTTRKQRAKAGATKTASAKKGAAKPASPSKTSSKATKSTAKPARAHAKAETKTRAKKAAATNAAAKPVGKPGAAPVRVAPVPPRKLDFKTGDFVVYPTHGVGRIQKIDEQHVAGVNLELFVIGFDKDKMILRVPTAKATAVGMRKLSTPDVVANALKTLKGRARIKRTMWSRRAQEYEAKINSGDLVAIAEVVRDLHRAGGQPEQSYSERQLYEAALARMAREVAAIERIEEEDAVKRVEGQLMKKAA
jgi:CarD family transcriptional regulator